MVKKVIEFHADAGAEYDAAFDWYLERSADAAIAFSDEVGSALNQIARSPQRWASDQSSTHRFLLRKFPYLVIYRERRDATIQVVAIAHTSRNPGYWKHRVEAPPPL